MQTIKCDCGTELLVVPSIKAMDKAVTKHLKTCTAQKNSDHDLYFVLINKMVDAIIQPIADQTFCTQVTGGCAGHLNINISSGGAE